MLYTLCLEGAAEHQLSGKVIMMMMMTTLSLLFSILFYVVFSARSAKLPEGLYILPMFCLYFFIYVCC